VAVLCVYSERGRRVIAGPLFLPDRPGGPTPPPDSAPGQVSSSSKSACKAGGGVRRCTFAEGTGSNGQRRRAVAARRCARSGIAFASSGHARKELPVGGARSSGRPLRRILLVPDFQLPWDPPGQHGPPLDAPTESGRLMRRPGRLTAEKGFARPGPDPSGPERRHPGIRPRAEGAHRSSR